MKDTIKIFSETGCIPHEVLWKYRQGTLSPREKHEVELHLTDCELCSDALAGMMSMENDAVVSELRRSVRNISAPKKVIRFYNFRILAAAAAVAVFFVFIYVIKSSDKNQNKEIALLTQPKEKINDESFSISNSQPTDEEGLLKKKTEDLISLKAVTRTPAEQKINSETGSVTPQEQTVIAEAGAALSQTNVDHNDNAENETAAAPTEAKSENQSGNVAPPAATVVSEKRLQLQANKSGSRSKKTESSMNLYFHDLKVAKTPAMTPVEKFDTVSTGTPAMYESKTEDVQEKPARELPFVYSKTLKDGIGYYKNKKYQYAIQTFDIILERFPSDINATFYKGLSEMESENFSVASLLLSKVVILADTTFRPEAKFKLAQCYASLNKISEAKNLFEEIISENGFYKVSAGEELKKLK